MLESVLALTLISICLFMATMVYNMVFAPQTSVKSYFNQNKANEFFYIRQIGHDSLVSAFDSVQWQVEEEQIGKISRITVMYKDSFNVSAIKTFYVANGYK